MSMLPRYITRPFYQGKAWHKCRAGYIKSVGGLCERCLAKGKIKQGYIVHHKTWLTEDNINDPTVSLNWDNLEYLCFDCHQKETFEKTPIIKEGLKFDSNGDLVQSVPPSVSDSKPV